MAKRVLVTICPMIKNLFKALSVFPLPVLHALGACLGWAVYGLSASYRRKIEIHSKIAFPHDELARLAAVKGSVRHAGMALLELPFLWGLSTQQGAARCTTRAPITVLYRPNRKAELQDIIEDSRARDNVALAPTTIGGVKILLKALKRGEAVGMLPDQVPAQGEGVWAPMFGQPAYTMTLPGRLHHATGASIVLAIGYRKPGGQGFTLELYQGPESLSADPVEAAAQVNAAMERLIQMHPEQYYWGYERYKPPKGQQGHQGQS